MAVPGWLRTHLATWWPVWIAWAVTRLGVVAVGIGAQYASAARGIEHLPFLQSSTFVHYADVVRNGYTAENATQFPLLPLLMGGLSSVGLPLAVASFVVVNVAFLAGLVGMAMLGERYVGRAAAVRAATYLALFPTAYVFSLGSTESLMLAGLCGAVLCALRATPGMWLAAGVFAAACALTRPPGAFVGLVLLAIAVSQLRDGRLGRRGVAAAVTAGAAIPAAVLVFFAYLGARLGDPLAAMHAQEGFGRDPSLLGPWYAVRDATTAVVSGTLGPAAELLALALLVGAIVWFAQRAVGDRWEVRGWTMFSAASLALPLSTGLVWQMPRFALLVPPLFWALGVAGRRPWIHQAFVTLFAMALSVKLVFEIAGVTQ